MLRLAARILRPRLPLLCMYMILCAKLQRAEQPSLRPAAKILNCHGLLRLHIPHHFAAAKRQLPAFCFHSTT